MLCEFHSDKTEQGVIMNCNFVLRISSDKTAQGVIMNCDFVFCEFFSDTPTIIKCTHTHAPRENLAHILKIARAALK